MTATAQPAAADTAATEIRRTPVTVRGALALFAARLLALPAGEYMIHLDTRDERRPRWRVAQVDGWEKPARE